MFVLSVDIKLKNEWTKFENSSIYGTRILKWLQELNTEASKWTMSEWNEIHIWNNKYIYGYSISCAGILPTNVKFRCVADEHWLILSFSTWDVSLSWLRKPCMCNLPQNSQFSPRKFNNVLTMFLPSLFPPASFLLLRLCNPFVSPSVCETCCNISLAFCNVIY